MGKDAWVDDRILSSEENIVTAAVEVVTDRNFLRLYFIQHFNKDEQ